MGVVARTEHGEAALGRPELFVSLVSLRRRRHRTTVPSPVLRSKIVS